MSIKGQRESGMRPTKGEAVAYITEREAKLRRFSASGIHVGRPVEEAFRRYAKDVSVHKPGYRWETIKLDEIGRMEIQGVKIADMKFSDLPSDSLGRFTNQRLTVEKVNGSTVSRDFNLCSHVFSTAASEMAVDGGVANDQSLPAKAGRVLRANGH